MAYRVQILVSMEYELLYEINSSSLSPYAM